METCKLDESLHFDWLELTPKNESLQIQIYQSVQFHQKVNILKICIWFGIFSCECHCPYSVQSSSPSQNLLSSRLEESFIVAKST